MYLTISEKHGELSKAKLQGGARRVRQAQHNLVLSEPSLAHDDLRLSTAIMARFQLSLNPIYGKGTGAATALDDSLAGTFGRVARATATVRLE